MLYKERCIHMQTMLNLLDQAMRLIFFQTDLNVEKITIDIMLPAEPTSTPHLLSIPSKPPVRGNIVLSPQTHALFAEWPDTAAGCSLGA